MPRHLLLEGSDPQALMMRVREELGPDARVIRAEEVRSGGFLGFFARRHFELTVEVPEAGEARRASAQVQEAQADDEALAREIADARAAREELLSGAAHLAARAQEASAVAAHAAGADQATPDTVAKVTYEEPSAPAAESTDMAEFDKLVLRLTQEAEGAVPVREDEPGAADGFRPAAFPIADRSASTVLGAGAPTREERPAEDRPQADSPVTGGIALPGTVFHRTGAYPDVAAAGRAASAPALQALGVPTRYLSHSDSGASDSLLDVIARFRTPAVRRPEPADLVVIAGPADEAVRVATQVAAWLDLEPTSVVLAGRIDAIRGHGRRVVTDEAARGARRRAHEAGKSGTPLIVALGVDAGPRGAAEALPMLEALDADTVWWVADASRRVSALNATLSVVAQWRPVDGIAAVDLAQAQAPGAILDAQAPITWMDGLPAASVVWAALLSERLAELDS